MANKKFECEICKIFTTDQATLDNHFLGSKHQLTLHRNLVKEKKEKCGIYVTGFLNNTKKDDIMQFFSKFGKIVDCHTGGQGNFAIVQFDKEEVAQKLLNKRLTYKSRYLNIRPRKMKNVNEIQGPPKQDPHFERIFALVSKQKTFDSQLTELVNVLQVHEKFLDPPDYNRVCFDLEQSLRSKFPFCRVWPFGSTVSGLGFINSDIDIYVDVVQHLDVQSSSEPHAAVYTRIARNILWKSGIFSNVIAIPKAKTPIVKLIHRPTGINCDINFKNLLGVCNSTLIRFLLTLDVRLRPYMFIIKYWAKINDISGSGKISNYGLVLMMVFFLQRDPCPILPPIEIFQGNTRYVEGWNGSFIENPNLVPPKCRQNNFHITRLLHGFFSYWAKFDYGFNVICPYTSEIIPKANFSNPDTLSNSFTLYKANLCNKEPLKTDSPICLQDPIELNHNVTASVAARQLEDFQKLCEISADIVLKNKTSDILPKLLTRLQIDKGTTVSDEKCSFKITGTAINLSNDKETDTKNVHKLWFEKVNQFFVSVLSKLFLFEVKAKKDVQQNSKAQKLDGQSDIHDTTVVDVLTFHCIGYNNVWEARKSISKNLGDMLDKTNFLENEIAISEYIVNVLCKGLKIKDPLVDFNLTINFKVNPTEAEFVLNNVKSRKNSFKVMANFFASKVPGWFVRYLKDIQNTKSENEIITDGKTDKQTQPPKEKLNEIIEDSDGDD